MSDHEMIRGIIARNNLALDDRRYDDQLARQADGTWLFAERSLRFL